MNQQDMRDSLRRVEALEYFLERSIDIPFLGRRIGLDSIIGLVPAVGDLVTGAMSAYIIWEAKRLGVPKWKLARMMANTGFDTALGAVPVLGDLFDLAFRSNTRNLRILKDHLAKSAPGLATLDATASSVRYSDSPTDAARS